MKDQTMRHLAVALLLLTATILAGTIGFFIVGYTLAESPIKKELNIIIIGMTRANGELIYNPLSSTVLQSGDRLIAVGKTENIKKLAELSLK